MSLARVLSQPASFSPPWTRVHSEQRSSAAQRAGQGAFQGGSIQAQGVRRPDAQMQGQARSMQMEPQPWRSAGCDVEDRTGVGPQPNGTSSRRFASLALTYKTPKGTFCTEPAASRDSPPDSDWHIAVHHAAAPVRGNLSHP